MSFKAGDEVIYRRREKYTTYNETSGTYHRGHKEFPVKAKVLTAKENSIKIELGSGATRRTLLVHPDKLELIDTA